MGIFRSRRAVPAELETLEPVGDNSTVNQSIPVPAQLATGNTTMDRVPTTTAEMAPTPVTEVLI
jgi:hypothetical protein